MGITCWCDVVSTRPVNTRITWSTHPAPRLPVRRWSTSPAGDGKLRWDSRPQRANAALINMRCVVATRRYPLGSRARQSGGSGLPRWWVALAQSRADAVWPCTHVRGRSNRSFDCTSGMLIRQHSQPVAQLCRTPAELQTGRAEADGDPMRQEIRGSLSAAHYGRRTRANACARPSRLP